MADPTNSEPSSIPWYQSPVQRAAVAATLTSMAAVLVQMFEVNVDVEVINIKIGLALQLANLGFGLWAIVKRAFNKIQPLTLTKASAEVKAERMEEQAMEE